MRRQPIINALEERLALGREERFEFRQCPALDRETQGAPLKARTFRGLSHDVVLESCADILEHASPEADLVLGKLTRDVIALQCT